MNFSRLMSVAILLLALCVQQAFGLRFVMDEQCFSHDVQYERDTVHVAFVVIKTGSLWHTEDGGDPVVKAPDGDQTHDTGDQISEKLSNKKNRKSCRQSTT